MKQLAIITGGGSGIGRALACELIARGLHVLVTGRRVAPLQSLQDAYPEQVFFCSADVSTQQGRQAMIDAIPSGFSLQYVVHNAGMVTPTGSLLDVDLDAYRKAWQVNVEGPLFLTQLCADCMGAGSRIMHISSGGAHQSIPGIKSYCSTKAALYNLYLGLKEELLARGIALASVMPGIVDTPMQSLMRDHADEHAPELDKFKDLKSGNRLVSSHVVARFLAWLLLDVDAAQFQASEWDIYQNSGHERWLGGEVVVLPEGK